MTPKTLRNLLADIEGACAMPLVASRPLMVLTDTLSHLECGDELDDLDESLQALVDAAIDVSGDWSFWPPDQYGSATAMVDAGAVQRLAETLHKYRETRQCPLEPLKTGDKARKVGGSYQATGWIVSAFTTRSGALRYVFEFDGFPGMLHILNDSQLEKIE